MRIARSVPVVAAMVLATALVAAMRAQEQVPTWPREPEQPSAPKPAPPFRDWYLLMGEYESTPAPGRPAVHLYVLERDARLMVIADRGPARDVNTTTPRPAFTRDAARRATALTIGGVVHLRLQVGPEGGASQLRVTPIRPVAEVLKESQSQTPPAEAGSFLPADLVELTSLDPTITLDVRYATTNNFLGSVFYAEARAFLQRPAAEALVRVQRALAPLGYGLLVHDGYRPWSVTKTFWETTPADRKWLVANPAQGSRHNRGAAVDLTLYDLKTGAVIEMPSTYDESTPRAYAFYPGGTSLQRWHRALLRRVMEAEGFAVNPEEWWHFDHQDWRRYAIGNVPFDRIQRPPVPGEAVEQTAPGAKPALPVLASFDGLGAGLHAGDTPPRNPSDNSLAVGPNHIMQIVNSQLAVFSKAGAQFSTTGQALHGPVATHTLFAGHGEVCGSRANGDAVVRYDQLASRWLVVMPIFRRAVVRPPGEAMPTGPAPPGEPARPGQASGPGPPGRMSTPPPAPPPSTESGPGPTASEGSYAICYAISTSADPLGSYHRYVFERPLFPDYPRPAVWPDGYYVPTSTGDDVIQKHVCVADRARMLLGQPAAEQCLVVDGVNFLNNADLDGTTLPPAGAPNLMMAAGGAQLRNELEDDGIYVWKLHVDWTQPSRTALTGPRKIAVAPYRYLCGGQLTSCVPQPGVDRRLDAQGDKLMARLVYRNVGGRESIVAVHSVDTAAGGGVRWYEFRLDAQGDPQLFQQSTYAPGGSYRWMASPAMDRRGNIGIGYSFGDADHFPGQRFAARLADDPTGTLTFHESVLVEGEGAQTTTLRWEDYTQTAVDPSDDCTIWYVGDYLQQGAASYSTRIGAFRLSGCQG